MQLGYWMHSHLAVELILVTMFSTPDRLVSPRIDRSSLLSKSSRNRCFVPLARITVRVRRHLTPQPTCQRAQKANHPTGACLRCQIDRGRPCLAVIGSKPARVDLAPRCKSLRKGSLAINESLTISDPFAVVKGVCQLSRRIFFFAPSDVFPRRTRPLYRLPRGPQVTGNRFFVCRI
jgi:hypothetical protein